MSRNKSKWPSWDGLSPNRESLDDNIEPGFEDWDQIVAEVLALQDGFDQAAVAGLTDSSGGTTDGTIEAVPSDTLANVAAASNNNFAEINAKLDSILAALRTAKVIKT